MIMFIRVRTRVGVVTDNGAGGDCRVLAFFSVVASYSNLSTCHSSGAKIGIFGVTYPCEKNI